MKKVISLGAALVCFALATPIYASSDVLQKLKGCARTQNDSQRIECYELLGKSVLETDTATSASGDSNQGTAKSDVGPIATTPENQTTELPDSIGGGKYARDAGVPKEQFRGLLKSCKKSADKRWFYIFENGQVWKQVQHKKIRHKNCDVNATLTKDGFGYIMRIDQEDRKVRVKRHR